MSGRCGDIFSRKLNPADHYSCRSTSSLSRKPRARAHHHAKDEDLLQGTGWHEATTNIRLVQAQSSTRDGTSFPFAYGTLSNLLALSRGPVVLRIPRLDPSSRRRPRCHRPPLCGTHDAASPLPHSTAQAANRCPTQKAFCESGGGSGVRYNWPQSLDPSLPSSLC